MIIKAGSITNLTDARFFAGYGVAYLGFCFDPQSPYYISPQQALAIKGWLHGVQIVAEFANQDAANIKGIIDFLQPDVLQFDDADMAEMFRNTGLPLILSISGKQLHQIAANTYLFLLITDYNNKDISSVISPLMLDFSDKKIDISAIPIAAAEIKGTPESEVGLKDYERLADLLDSLSGRN